MATALELFEVFLQKDNENEYAYHQHDVKELIAERDQALKEIVELNIQIAVTNNDETIASLRRERAEVNDTLENMERVLSFCIHNHPTYSCRAIEGCLITKKESSEEWYEQTPIYFTEDYEKANRAFDFFNAHAVITAQ